MARAAHVHQRLCQRTIQVKWPLKKSISLTELPKLVPKGIKKVCQNIIRFDLYTLASSLSEAISSNGKYQNPLLLYISTFSRYSLLERIISLRTFTLLHFQHIHTFPRTIANAHNL